MATNFELIGVEAVIAGIAAFERDAATVNRLLAQLNRSTQDLSVTSLASFGSIENVANAAFTAVAVGAASAVTALAGIASGAVAVAASFEQSLLRTAAVTGSVGADAAALGQSVLTAGANSRLGLEEIANGENALARAGFTATEITSGLLDVTVKFAEASGGQLGAAQAAQLVSEGVKAFGLSSADAITVVNAMTAAVNTSVIRYQDLGIILRQVAPIASSLGISFADLLAEIGVLGQAGISGSIAGSALKDVLVKLADPSKNAAKELKTLGVTIQDTNGNILPFREIIQLLSKDLSDQAVASGKISAAFREQALAVLFGTRGIEAGLAVVRGGVGAFDALSAAVRNTNVVKLADDMRASLIPQLDVTRNILQGLAIAVGTPLEQALATAQTRLNALLRSIDPRVPQAFGAALLAAFTGRGVAEVGTQLQAAFSPQLAGIIQGILNIILALRSALLDRLVPAVVILVRAFTGGVGDANAFSGALDSIAGVITRVADIVSRVVVSFADLITQIRQDAAATELLNIALRALVVIPLVAFAAILVQVLLTVGAVAIQVVALSAAFAVVSNVISQAGGNWNTIVASMRDSIDRLVAAVSPLLPVIEALAALIALRFTAIAVLGAITALELFASRVGLVANSVNIVAGALVGYVARAAAFVVSVVAQTAALIFYAAVAAGSALIATVQLTGAFVLLAGQAVITATVLVVQFLAAQGALRAFQLALVTLQLTLQGLFTISQAAPAILGLLAQGFLAVGSVAIQVAVAGIQGLAVALLNMASTAVPSALAALRALGAQLLTLATTSIAAATAALRTLAVTLVTSLVAAVNAALAVIAPFVLGLGVIAVVALAVYLAFRDNFLGIRDVAQSVIDFVVAKVQQFLTLISQIPIVAQVLGIARNAFNDLQTVAVPALERIGADVQNYISLIVNGFPAVDAQIATQRTQIDSLTQGWNAASASLLAYTADQQAFFETQGLQIGGPQGVPTPPFVTPGAAIQPFQAGATGVKDLTKDFERLLVVLPGNVRSLAEFVNQLNQITPGRGAGLVASLLAARDTIIQIADQYGRVIAAQEASRQVQEQINALTAQQSVLALQQQAATIGLEQQLLALKGQELVIEEQISVIDAKIQSIQSEDFNNLIAQDRIRAQILPTLQQIANIETEINRVVDQRTALLAQQVELTQREALDQSNLQLARINLGLNSAFQTGNVAQILALEKQKFAIENTITSQQLQLDVTKAQQQVATDTADIQKNALEQQVAALQATITPLQDQLTLLEQQRAIVDANNKIIIDGLNQQKAALLQVLDPLKQQSQLIQSQIDLIKNRFDQQKLQIDAQLINLKLEQEALKTIQSAEDARFSALVLGYVNTQVASGRWTATEAIESVKRLGFFTAQTDEIGRIITAFGTAAKAADAVTAEIAKIPTDVTVTVHIVTVGQLPSFQAGGIVPGAPGTPQLVIAHGGERFLGVGAASNNPLLAQQPGIGNNAPVINNTTFNTYEVNASYAQVQSQSSIGQDLRALVAATRH